MPNPDGSKTALEQIGAFVLPQLLNIVAGYILSLQGKSDESSVVLQRVGLPTDINISPEDFLKFLENQKKVV